MDQAIGSKIADYLIKPVNPNQILLSLKKNIHRKDIVTEVTQSGYQQDYQQIAMQMMDCRNFQDWMEVYRRLVKWELELSDTDSSMTEMLSMQKEEANIGFAKYIARNYMDWVDPKNLGKVVEGRPVKENRLEKFTISIDSSIVDDTLVNDLKTLVENDEGHAQLFIQIHDSETNTNFTMRAQDRAIGVSRELIQFVNDNPKMSYQIN